MIVALLCGAIVIVIGLGLQPHPTRLPNPGTGASVHAQTTILSRWARRIGRRRPATASPADLARWLDDISTATRSGQTLSAAVRSAPRPEHAEVTIAEIILMLDRGAPLIDALAVPIRPAPDLGLALTVLRACAEHGGAPAQALDRAAATLRARAADTADRATQSAQARLSAAVMTWLPLAMLLVLLTTSGAVRQVLVSPLGAIIAAVGFGLNLAGWRWMRHIVGGRAR